nr:hypothetical protein Ade03nite_48110 [Actinoplanes derwentensis]
MARTPKRSSPDQPAPVTIHPEGSGQGHQSGIRSALDADSRSTAPTISALMCSATWNGGTSPQLSHRQVLCIRSGLRT